MASPTASDQPSAEGPVLSVVNKRLRALRKKLNRVYQMEENVTKGKTLNKEQEEVLRSKPQLLALIDEYERLRSPLSVALSEELSLHQPPPPPQPEPSPRSDLDDLIKLLYVAQLFDVRPQAEYETTMLMRAHERGCCITYDVVTDETTSLLEERDLDAIAALGGAILARAPASDASHRGALAECVRRAELWVAASEEPIEPGSGFTYAGLRERLNRIWASNYSTATPEMKPSIDFAVEVGKYVAGQVQGVEQPAGVYAEAKATEFESKVDELEDSGNKETGTNESSLTDEPTESNDSDAQAMDASQQPEVDKQPLNDAEEQNHREVEPEQQQYMSRRPYTNQRPVRNDGRRGYSNGRGGRGRGSSYNGGRGRNQYYDSSYHSTNYYAPRARNGRGGSSYNGGQGSGAEVGVS